MYSYNLAERFGAVATRLAQQVKQFSTMDIFV
jgi:hypothetical protein